MATTHADAAQFAHADDEQNDRQLTSLSSDATNWTQKQIGTSECHDEQRAPQRSFYLGSAYSGRLANLAEERSVSGFASDCRSLVIGDSVQEPNRCEACDFQPHRGSRWLRDLGEVISMAGSAHEPAAGDRKQHRFDAELCLSSLGVH